MMEDVRERVGIRPGQKVEAFAGPVELIRAFRGRFPELPPLVRAPDRL
jgi:hypothetical protein